MRFDIKIIFLWKYALFGARDLWKCPDLTDAAFGQGKQMVCDNHKCWNSVIFQSPQHFSWGSPKNWTSLSKKCIQIPSFGPARPQRAKHCITNAFLYTFRGVWRHRADFHKNAFFRKIGIPIGLLCFYEILNLAMYFLFLLKSVTRTNTYNSQGISMIWRQVDAEFPKNHENKSPQNEVLYIPKCSHIKRHHF